MLTKEEQKKFNVMALANKTDIQDLCEAIITKYEIADSELKSLRNENNELKDGEWAKKQMKILRADYNTMKEEYYRGFPISKEEQEKINEFKDRYKGQNFGAIGGAFTYQFTPTSIGVSGKIIGPDGKEFEFSEIG